MPTAEEVLALLQSTDSSLPEYHFSISEDLRTITIPDGQELLGVAGDIDVRKVWFDMPRECDGTDMSGFDIAVKWKNAAGELGQYIPQSRTVTDDTVTFYWLVGKIPLAVSGKCWFSVVFTLYDGDDLLKRFNTVPTYGIVEKNVQLDESDIAHMGGDLEEFFSDQISTMVDSALSSMAFLNYKGSLDTYQELLAIEEPSIGDTYNVVTAYGEHAAGTDFVFDGFGWDALSGKAECSCSKVVPHINGHEIDENTTLEDIGINRATNQDILALFA